MSIVVNYENSSNVEPLDSGSFEVDQSQISKLLNVLSDVYNEPYSPVREYVTNGLRTTQQAGTNKPVEVNFFRDNSDENESVTITDYGQGMNFDDMKKNFLWFGRSELDDLENSSSVAGLGIGAKAAFSLSPMYFVESTKDGVTTNMKIYKKGAVPQWDMMGQYESDEPNGTSVYHCEPNC